ncbi:MAG: GNAT family N-acetyltransferase [Burkholderiales bacterium]
MSTGPLLRLATRDDASMIARLSRDRIEQGLGWSWTTPRVLRSIRDRETNVVVAANAGMPLGFGIMKYHDDEAHLLLLAVHPEHARQGIGTALIDWLERAALVAGIGRVMLEARLTNADARAFYRRLGYQEIQSLPGYYQGQEACVRLAKDLWISRAVPG